MHRKTYLTIFFVCLFWSCDQLAFKNDLPKVLGISDVKIENSQRIDVSGGIRKSYLLEAYELSPQTVSEFLTSSAKILPVNTDFGTWVKFGWTNQSFIDDSLYSQIAPITLNSNWGDAKLDNVLDKIKQAIDKKHVYYGYYCKPDLINPEYVQLYILDTLSYKLYIIDSNM